MSIQSIKQNRFAKLLSVGVLCGAGIVLSACERTVETADKGPAEIAGKQLDKAAVEAGRGLKQAAEETGKVIEKAGAKLQEKAQEAQK
ncbi:MAG: hypothetical protein V4695_02690 [Pseudomonadota bacterium]